MSVHCYIIDKSKLSIIYTADVTSTALCGFLVFTRIDINNFFSASRDIRGGGLAKFRRLAAG